MPTHDTSSDRTPFSVQAHDDGDGTRTVVVAGEVDSDTCPDLDDALADPMSGSTTLLDLSAVTFMDSAGLRCLVRSVHAHIDGGASIRLHDESGQVRRLLSMTGLYDSLRRGFP